MTLDEFKAQANRFMESFHKFLDGYEEANPEWMSITLLQVLYKAIVHLKNLIENPEEKNITWENPFTELQYPVLANWEKVEPHYFTLTQEDFKGQAGPPGEKPEPDYSKLTEEERKARDRLAEKFVGAFITVKEVYIFRLLTKEILLVLDKDKWGYKLPLALEKKLAKLSKEERGRRIERMITKPARIKLFDIPTRGKRPGRVYLIFGVGPCVLSVDEKRAYYPILIGLDFTGFRPKDLDEEARAGLLDGIVKGALEAIPKENLDFLERPGPEPTAKPVSKEAPLVKVPLHTELQKIGHRDRQLGLFDFMDDNINKEITEKKIEVIGLDISQGQNQALFAIQKLFTETNYKGNIPGQYIESRGFSFKGFLPALQFTPAQYLEAFGLKKIKTARGWEEYSGEERRQAFQALVDLTKPFLFVYTRDYIEKGKPVQDRIEKISPLILITRGWEGLTKQEGDSLNRRETTKGTDEKLRAIAIEPSPILVKGIDKFFVLKPADYAQEIKFLVPHASKFVYRFIDWLITQAELKRRHKKPLVIQENFEEIAYHLRMDAYIKSNQFKRIRQILNKCYRVAKDLGYLLSYGTVRGETKDLERLELNPEKFSRVREIEEELERLEDKKPSH